MSGKATHGEGSAMRSSASGQFRVTVLRSRKTRRVLFLEAGKDFVDTLFSLMLLPVGTVMHMLSQGGQGKPSWGGISSILKRVKKPDIMLLHVDRTHLVEPRAAAARMCASTVWVPGMKAQKMESPPQKRTVPSVYYMCRCCMLISSRNGAQCTNCSAQPGNHYAFHTGPYTVCAEDVRKQESSLEQGFVSVKENSSTTRGFVKESNTYLVTDNILEIMPSTTIRSINVLNKLEVGNIADLESTDITVTITQVLQLLQASLTSSTCLNDVFGKK